MNNARLNRHELIVDNFAGGGGASMGIEMALGRQIDIAINHDREAIAMHTANHPWAQHLCEDVWDVDPVKATQGWPVGLAWFSPDCTYHSKARGGKPFRTADRADRIRGLAWIAIKWANAVRPRIIIVENVEEFQFWGPLVPVVDDRGQPILDSSGDPKTRPCPQKKGSTFFRWVRQLENLGYRVEWRLLRACDYGAPTIRKRLFIVARCDGQPICWPKPTHGPGLLPYRSAAECIDWSLPCPSIFDRKKPLAEATLRRIAQGIKRYVLDSCEPFIVGCGGRAGQSRPRAVSEPYQTITAKADACLVMPSLMVNTSGHPGSAIDEPLRTVTTGNHHALVAAFFAKHYGGHTTPGWGANMPLSTITAHDHHAVIAVHLLNMKGSRRSARNVRDPAPTVCAQTTHAYLVAAMMAPYYGGGSGLTGRDLREPVPTITTKDRFQLVSALIDGADYVLADIGMRMLTPRELYRAQGFPEGYVIDPEVNGKRLSKAAQVRMCGNSVSPPVAAAVVAANLTTRPNSNDTLLSFPALKGGV